MDPAIRRLLAWVAAMATTLLFAGVVASDPKGLFGSTVAAWVQAIGSVAAIWTTVAIYKRQAAETRAREDRERTVRAAETKRLRRQELEACRMPVIGLCTAMDSTFMAICVSAPSKPRLANRAAEVVTLAQSRAEYDRTPLGALGDAVALMSASAIRKRFGIFESAYELYMAIPPNSPPAMPEAQRKAMEVSVTAVRHHFSAFEERVTALLVELD